VKFIEFAGDKMIVDTPEYEHLKVGLCGEYQLKNIATTITAVRGTAKTRLRHL